LEGVKSDWVGIRNKFAAVEIDRRERAAFFVRATRSTSPQNTMKHHLIHSVFGSAILVGVALVSTASAVVNIAYMPVGMSRARMR
jgi:hypothetical protein